VGLGGDLRRNSVREGGMSGVVRGGGSGGCVVRTKTDVVDRGKGRGWRDKLGIWGLRSLEI